MDIKTVKDLREAIDKLLEETELAEDSEIHLFDYNYGRMQSHWVEQQWEDDKPILYLG